MAIHHIPIAKAGKRTIEIDSSAISAELYAYALELGLKSILNRGMTGIHDADFTGPDAEKKYHAAAFAVAEKNVAKAYADDIRMVGVAKTKEPKKGERYIVALDICRKVVKSQWKAAGNKMAGVSAKTWTEVATAELNRDTEMYLRQADAVIAAQKVETSGALDLSLVKVDEKAVAKAEKAKADKKAKAAATKAGKTPPVAAKPKGKPTAKHV